MERQSEILQLLLESVQNMQYTCTEHMPFHSPRRVYLLKWTWHGTQQQNVRDHNVAWILEYFSHDVGFKERPVVAFLLAFSMLPQLDLSPVSF